MTRRSTHALHAIPSATFRGPAHEHGLLEESQAVTRSWTDRLAERVMLELMRSTTHKEPRYQSWAELRGEMPYETIAGRLRRLRASVGMLSEEDARWLLDMADAHVRQQNARSGRTA